MTRLYGVIGKTRRGIALRQRLHGTLVAVMIPMVGLIGLSGCEEAPETAAGPVAELYDPFVRDDLGRALVLHGANDFGDGKHRPGGHPSLAEEDVERRIEWGFNVARYLIFWRWVEPEKGVFDTAYLDEVAKRVKWYRDRGLYVILDMHQDIYGYAVNGNGAPPWATETDGLDPVDIGTGPWWLQNIDFAVKNAWKNFWEYGEHKYLQDHYIQAWQFVAEYFKDDPAVIGYDMMNEPYAGSFNISVTEEFESTWLTDFYSRLVPGIREVDPDTYIFFEPQSVLIVFGMPSRIVSVTDPRPGEQRLGFAPHLYPYYFHEGEGLRESGLSQLRNWELNRRFEAEKFKTPIFVGEFGGSDFQDGSDTYYRHVMEMFDAMNASWALWTGEAGSWGPIYSDGSDAAKLDYLVRTYPHATAGTPNYYRFDHDSKVFEMEYVNRQKTSGTTDIFIPVRHYPNGWDLEFSDQDGSWSQTFDDKTSLLKITHNKTQTTHRVIIRPKP